MTVWLSEVFCSLLRTRIKKLLTLNGLSVAELCYESTIYSALCSTGSQYLPSYCSRSPDILFLGPPVKRKCPFVDLFFFYGLQLKRECRFVEVWFFNFSFCSQTSRHQPKKFQKSAYVAAPMIISGTFFFSFNSKRLRADFQPKIRSNFFSPLFFVRRNNLKNHFSPMLLVLVLLALELLLLYLPELALCCITHGIWILARVFFHHQSSR